MLRKSAKAGIGGAVFVAMLLASAMMSFQPFGVDGPDDGRASICETNYTGAIRVNVASDINRTIVGAVVHLVGNDTGWTTDYSGVALITGLLADTNETEYTLWTEADGYVSSSPMTVVVTLFNTTYANLTVRGGVIVGTVTEDGTPIADANVSIPSLDMSTSTDSDGSYRLDGIVGGNHSINASALNHVPSPPKTVTVPTGGTVAVYFSLSSVAGEISGTVLHSETLEPLENANVSVTIGIITITISTNANGSYSISGLPAGVYTLTANLEGFNESTVEGVVVESGETTEEVELLLDEKTTMLWGVVKAGTVLLVGANVSIPGTEYFGKSSIEGEYQIVGLPAGTYTVAASLQGYDNITVSDVEIKRGGEVRLNFNLTGLPGALYGIVVDAVTGQELAGVIVVVLPQRETITNTNGEFQFTGMPADEYIIRFTLDGYQPKEIGPIETTLDETTEMGRIELEPTREGFGGFIFGFDLAHSMMILALFLTIVILAFAVVLRIRTFEAPDKAPAVYDELDEEDAEESLDEDEPSEDEEDDALASSSAGESGASDRRTDR